MSDSQAVQAGVLVGKPPKPNRNAAPLLLRIAREAGVSPMRQAAELLRLQHRERRITFQDYYDNQVYRTELSLDEKREFIGVRGSKRLNLRLGPPNLTELRGFLRDKVAFTSLLSGLGLPATRNQAVVSPERHLGMIPVLRSCREIESFLRSEAVYPLFGKPTDASRGQGTAAFASYDPGSDTLERYDGSLVRVSDFAVEVARDYGSNYLFQNAIDQHPALVDLVGRAASTPRIVTVFDDGGPRVLYAYWKIAAWNGVSDNFWQPGSLIGALDIRTGALKTCRSGKGADTQWHEAHPVTGRPLIGFRLPHWKEVVDLACKAHAVFPVNGCLGWDIAIGRESPIVVEANSNTSHDTYQIATGRGFLTAEMRAALEPVKARTDRLVRERIAKRGRRSA